MTHTDHAAQASSALDGGRLHLAWAADAPTAPETNAHLQAAQAVFMAAQAEATLALVEQQRIANLITIAGWVVDAGKDDVRHDLNTLGVGQADAVWEALGLS